PADGFGLPNQYGSFPPIQSIVILKGPQMDADGSDNPVGIDEGINGYGFGDGIQDNECLGLKKFVVGSRQGPWITDPVLAEHYYNLISLQYGYQYGSTATLPDTLSCGPDTRYFFPGDTDTLHWGTNYVIPSCFENNWTEVTLKTQPFDRRCFASMGPFIFNSGAMQEIDIAFVFSRNFSDTARLGALPVMEQRIDSLRKYFVNDYTPCNGSFFGVQQKEADNFVFQIFPNPATNLLNFEITNADKNSVVTILDLYGNKIMSRNLNNKMNGSFDISGLSRGMYLISIVSGNKSISKKFIKL
ncbi:MAG: T9SS type A sorting domain-containing protein, partial [Bacteroidota bacterium]